MAVNYNKVEICGVDTTKLPVISEKEKLELINLRNRLRAQREEIKKLQAIIADLKEENEWLKTRAAV